MRGGRVYIRSYDRAIVTQLQRDGFEIVFELDEQGVMGRPCRRITAQLKDGMLNINGEMGTLVIHPDVSNNIHVDVKVDFKSSRPGRTRRGR